jgi:histidinol-phosphate aminotransferase
VVAGLAERDVAVRPGTPLGDPGHIRVSYGTPEENERFLRGLSEILD